MEAMINILSWLKINKSDIYDMFNDGAREEDLIKLKIKFPSLPNDVLDLYSLVNGQKDESNTFINGLWMPSINILLEYGNEWSHNAKVYGIDVPPYGIEASSTIYNVFWCDKWIPLLMSPDNDFGYLIDLNRNVGGKVGQIIFIDDLTRIVVSQSLSDFLEQIKNYLYTGAFKVKRDVIWLTEELI